MVLLKPLGDQITWIGLRIVIGRKFEATCNALTGLQECTGAGCGDPENMTLWLRLSKPVRVLDNDLRFPNTDVSTRKSL